MSTPSIPGVDRDALARAISGSWSADQAADAAIAYIAAHQEPRVCDCGSKYDRCPDCTADEAYEEGRKEACDLEHADEWVEGILVDLPNGARIRQEWAKGDPAPSRYFVHRDDLPDPDQEVFKALRNAAWPDVLPDALDAKCLLGRIREEGFDVVRKEER